MKQSFRILNVILTLHLLAVARGAEITASPAKPEPIYDLIVYGDSSGAVTAAVAARRQGRTVILINPPTSSAA